MHCAIRTAHRAHIYQQLAARPLRFASERSFCKVSRRIFGRPPRRMRTQPAVTHCAFGAECEQTRFIRPSAHNMLFLPLLCQLGIQSTTKPADGGRSSCFSSRIAIREREIAEMCHAQCGSLMSAWCALLWRVPSSNFDEISPFDTEELFIDLIFLIVV